MIVLPRFHMPFPPTGSNPLQADARAAMWDWAERFGLCSTTVIRRRMQRTQSELWCSLTDPAAGIDELTLRCQWTFWAFVVDDDFDDDSRGDSPADSREAVIELQDVLRGSRQPETSSAHALADLWQRTRAGRSASWQRAFRDDAIAWLWTYYHEAVERAAGQMPSLDEYLLRRRNSIGMGIFMDLFETPPAIDLPDHVRRLPALIALRNAVADHIALYNDICSAQKEGDVGYYHNAVFVLQHQQGGTVQDSVEQVDVLRAACIERVTRAEEQLETQMKVAAINGPTRTAVEETVWHYRTLLRGDFEYHARSQRYQPTPDWAEIRATPEPQSAWTPSAGTPGWA